MAPRSHRDKEGRADRDPNHLVLLARDATGYSNLVALSTIAHLEGYYYKPRIDKELLAAHSEGLICLSGCVGGELPQAILSGDLDAAERVARQHAEILGPDNYFLELQDHGMTEETAVREGLLEIARRTGLPLICTNDSHYIHASRRRGPRHPALPPDRVPARRRAAAPVPRSPVLRGERRGDAAALRRLRGGRIQHPGGGGALRLEAGAGPASPPGLFAHPRGPRRRLLPGRALRAGARRTVRRRSRRGRPGSGWRWSWTSSARPASPPTSSSSGT